MVTKKKKKPNWYLVHVHLGEEELPWQFCALDRRSFPIVTLIVQLYVKPEHCRID